MCGTPGRTHIDGDDNLQHDCRNDRVRDWIRRGVAYDIGVADVDGQKDLARRLDDACRQDIGVSHGIDDWRCIAPRPRMEQGDALDIKTLGQAVALYGPDALAGSDMAWIPAVLAQSNTSD